MSHSQEGQLEHTHLQWIAVVCNTWERQLECNYPLYVYMRAIKHLCRVHGCLQNKLQLFFLAVHLVTS